MEDEYSIISGSGSANANAPTGTGTSPSPKNTKATLTAALHGIVAVHDLPANITRLQQRAVEKLAYECERKAYIRSTKHICLNCEYRGKASGIRLCTLTRTLLCQNKCEGCLLSINMIGKVVVIMNKHYVFATCCNRIVQYTASTEDLWVDTRLQEFLGHTHTCSHVKEDRRKQRKAPKRPHCMVCNAIALPTPHEHLDTQSTAMVRSCLCQRHTPHDDCLRHVCTQKQFEIAVYQWEKTVKRRHKPRVTVHADA